MVASLPTFAVLTVAAQNVGFDPPFKPKLLEQKVRTVLHMAESNGHDSVVLGAFGCGYFNNPPEVVAGTFRRVLDSEFKDVFRVVLFGVIGGNELFFDKAFPMLKGKLPPAIHPKEPSVADGHPEDVQMGDAAQATHTASSKDPSVADGPPEDAQMGDPAQAAPPSGLTPTEKNFLKAVKDWRAVRKIEEMMATGEKLDKSQEEKLKKKDQFVNALVEQERALPLDSELREKNRDVIEFLSGLK